MGNKNKINSIIEIINYKDKILYQDKFDTSINKVLDPRVAFLLIDVLKDNIARSPHLVQAQCLLFQIILKLLLKQERVII